MDEIKTQYQQMRNRQQSLYRLTLSDSVPIFNTQKTDEVIKREQLASLIDVIVEITGINLRSVSLKGDITTARKVVAYYISKNHGLSPARIGLLIGGFNRTSVIHMLQSAQDMIDTKDSRYLRVQKTVLDVIKEYEGQCKI